MITVYEGRPGSGKSYCGSVEICKALAQGRWVYTNCSLKIENVKSYVESEFAVTFDGEFPLRVFEDGFECLKAFYQQMPRGTRELPSLGVLDEAQNFINARDWKEHHFQCKDLLVYLSQHRKLHHDLIFITQDADNIDAQIRRLTQSYYRFRDLARLSLPVLGRIWAFPQSLMVNVDYGGKLVLGRRLLTRSAKIFNIYESEALLMDNAFSSAGSVVVKKVDKKKELYLFVDKLAIPVAFILLLVFFWVL